MIIGHLGVALGARRIVPRAPLGWLLGATFAPDLWRLALTGAGYDWWPSNTLSHALPWSGIIAVVLGSVVWLVLRDGPAAVVIAVVVASHIALDMISGWKPLWIGGPTGLNVQQMELVEFMLEAALASLGWWLLTRTRSGGWLSTRTALLLMMFGQAAYLTHTYTKRPAAARCLTYPIASCWRRL